MVMWRKSGGASWRKTRKCKSGQTHRHTSNCNHWWSDVSASYCLGMWQWTQGMKEMERGEIENDDVVSAGWTAAEDRLRVRLMTAADSLLETALFTVIENCGSSGERWSRWARAMPSQKEKSCLTTRGEEESLLATSRSTLAVNSSQRDWFLAIFAAIDWERV